MFITFISLPGCQVMVSSFDTGCMLPPEHTNFVRSEYQINSINPLESFFYRVLYLERSTSRHPLENDHRKGCSQPLDNKFSTQGEKAILKAVTIAILRSYS